MLNSKYIIPASIIIASLIMSVSVVLSIDRGDANQTANVSSSNLPDTPVAENVMPVTERDHILGNLDAPIKIVEFSDFECPFCKVIHNSLHRIVDDYDGQVAWVYRHYPSDSTYPKARKEAEASECVSHYGGNEAFWKFADTIFEETPSNNRLDLRLLPDFAEEAGVDRSVFEACLESERFADRVQDDLKDAINSGARGTPHSVMIVGDGEYHVPIVGNQPYVAIKAFVDRALELL